MLGVEGGTYILRYGRCCFEMWEVLRSRVAGGINGMFWWPNG